MKKVLLATDASEHSIRAARLVHEMAQTDPEMEVTVFHVIPLPEVLSPAVSAGATLTVPMQLDEYLKGQLEHVLNVTLDALDLPPERVRRGLSRDVDPRSRRTGGGTISPGTRPCRRWCGPS